MHSIQGIKESRVDHEAHFGSDAVLLVYRCGVGLRCGGGHRELNIGRRKSSKVLLSLALQEMTFQRQAELLRPGIRGIRRSCVR